MVAVARTDPARVQPRGARGFTLLELLVAMLIMGLMLGLAAPVLQPDARSQLRDEAERLAQLFDLAASEARLSGRPMVWTSDGSGYRFWRADEPASGSARRDSDLWHEHTLPAGMRLAGLNIEALPVAGAMRLDFAGDGTASTFALELLMNASRVTVAASPLGEVRVLADAGVGDALTPGP